MNLTIKNKTNTNLSITENTARFGGMEWGGELDGQPSEWQRVNTNSPLGEKHLFKLTSFYFLSFFWNLTKRYQISSGKINM